MYDLFNPPPEKLTISPMQVDNYAFKIPGLLYVPNFITKEEESLLINVINSQSWLADIKRRVQHYGYKYDYKARTINYSMFLGPLPIWAMAIAKRLLQEGYISQEPDQLIINEYLPGQGIANHVDCEPCFGDSVISISLASNCVMDFVNINTRQKIELMLETRSLVVISNEARYKWTHGITQRKSDFYNGVKYGRKIRISMTFRKVIIK